MGREQPLASDLATDGSTATRIVDPARRYRCGKYRLVLHFSPDGKGSVCLARYSVRDLDTGLERILTEVASHTVLAYTKDEDLVTAERPTHTSF